MLVFVHSQEPDCGQFQAINIESEQESSHDSMYSQKVHEVRLLAPTWHALAEAVTGALALSPPDLASGRTSTSEEVSTLQAQPIWITGFTVSTGPNA